LNSGQIVDDASVVEIGNAVVDSSVGENINLTNEVQRFVKALPSENSFGLYIKLWVASRYLSAEWLMSEVRKTTFWRNDSMLGRLIGGIAPRLMASKYHSEFERLIHLLNNADAIEVADFHQALVHRSERFRVMRKFLTATNPSKTLRITHAKFLIICLVMHNVEVNIVDRKKLLEVHSVMLSDAVYRRFLFESFRPQEQLWEVAEILSPGQRQT